MVNGEDEVICDLAEQYHILNYRELPPSLVATLVVGLSDNSRIKRKISGAKLTLEQTLMAVIADGIQILVWRGSKDGQKNKNKPDSIYKKLLGIEDKKKDDLMVFESADDYEQWYKAKMR